ncbi:glycerol kinase [Neptuniibacter pectenicola]|jgi:hypothetical protein|uniref:glycerol kinase n=1 Tax=Neptuniibacter pectenicola TaxID=1806669 RepID=UPI000831CF60|nr:glycerol kinase [Neptuniibacter pectenicola]
MSKPLSTSALAKLRGIPGKELFSQLEACGFIQRKGNEWVLLPAGEKAGGQYVDHTKYGKYITWPDDLSLQCADKTPGSPSAQKLVTATIIGKAFNLSANRMNSILSELGWINKALKGWTITPSGASAGGEQKEDFRSGIPYVVWPNAITENKALKTTISEVQGESASEEAKPETNDCSNFRDKFEAKLRTTDGHYVRSKAEMLIDNWLYMAEIVHAYERKLPIEEEVYCDFYIPTGKVYIEYWGYENDSKYLHRKAQKQAIYARYGFKLIELEDADVQNLDDVLPRLLLKHGVQSY